VIRPLVSLPGAEGPNPNLDIEDLLGALAAIHGRWLRAHPRFPRLYQSGVRYRPEPIDEENWLCPAEVLKQGFGDCEDLTLWRCAELLARNVAARPKCIGRRQPLGGLTQHVFVVLPSGETEDPSLLLMPK
jgi:hypothetical protein